MKEFYCILGRSIAPQEALGRAKISLLHSGQRVVAPSFISGLVCPLAAVAQYFHLRISPRLQFTCYKPSLSRTPFRRTGLAPIPPFRRDSLAERAIAIKERAVSIGRTPEK
jgi:hypothetical protein